MKVFNFVHQYCTVYNSSSGVNNSSPRIPKKTV